MTKTPNLQHAIQYHQQGQLDKAEHIYEQLIHSNSRDADAHNLLGAVLVAKKQFKEAVKHLNKAVKLAPGYVGAHYNLGKCYVDMGQPKAALPCLRKAVQLDKTMLDGQFVLGNCLVQLGMLSEAIAAYEITTDLMPNHVEAINNLGNAWQDLMQPEKAVPYHQQALTFQPNYRLAMVSLAEAYRSLDRQLEAIELLTKVAQLKESADIYQSLGVNYQQIGNIVEAKQAYIRAFELDRGMGQAYRGFTEVHKAVNDEDLVMIADGQEYLHSNTDKMHWNFAMGHCLDARKEYMQAITYYDVGNSLHRQSYAYKHSQSEHTFKIIKQSYTQGFVSQPQVSSRQGEGIVFILGMPRSGTTLVEQIISSHSDVTGAGELVELDRFAKTFKTGFDKFHKQIVRVDGTQLCAMANQYLDYIDSIADGRSHVTDKLPHNFMNIGLIRKLLPKAKIVHCKRNPMANCLSIYKAYFSAKGSHKYAYNQKELAQYHNLYEDLMEHWRKELPGQFYEIKYEELTSNQEEESRKLIDYCGLDWQDACLDFYKTKRKVKTASAFQVRQPMSNKSVDLWKKYGEGLQPLIDALYIPEEYQD